MHFCRRSRSENAYYHDHICPSVCPRGITRLPLARFSSNLKCGIWLKFVDKFRVSLEPVKNRTLYMATYIKLDDWSLQWRHCSECRAKWGLKSNWRPKHFVFYYISRWENISRPYSEYISLCSTEARETRHLDIYEPKKPEKYLTT